MKRQATTHESISTRRHFLQAAGGAIAAAGLLQNGTLAAAEEPSDAKPKKLPFPLGLASYTTRKFNLDETLAMANRVGLSHICLKSFHLPMNATEDEIAQVAAKVKAAGIVLYGGGVISMGNEAAVDRAFEYAKAAGMTTIVGVPTPPMLPLVDKKVKQYDIKVAIHNHGPGDNTYPTPESIIEKVKPFDQRIGLCIDIGHTLRIGADPIRSAEIYADRLHDIHLKDVSAADPSGKPVEAGRGVIDLPAFLQTLIKIDYQGIASFEYEKDAGDPLPGLAESVGYIKGVLATL